MRADALIRFSKTGTMRYVGHLDLLKIFQKAIRRSGLPVNFSEGFNPHLRVSFALPLTLGMEGLREYAVFEMGEALRPETIRERFGAALPAGMAVDGVRYMVPGEKSPAAAVCAADYVLRFAGGDTEAESRVLGEGARALMEKTVAEVEKASKSGAGNGSKAGTKTVDIRPDIYELEVLGNEVKMRIAAGSARSLKPELVAATIAPGREYACARTELLKRAGEKFAPLF
ncbi:MAG: TIGR03936 family radical SAM-associated protein [Firmicutes bacterium]|nr:TIGR03936 family radical SAM-associated protein [Bacillota bacterium]